MGKQVSALSLKQKLQIINLAAGNVDKKELSRKYSCDISTINRILKNKDRIKSDARSGNLQRRRKRIGVHDKVEKALKVWFDQQRQQDATITTSILLNKAKELSIQLNDPFEPNPSWLWRWRQRHNIKIGKFLDEAKNNDEKCVSDFTTSILPDILHTYDPEDIFNAVETGLFYKALPNGKLFNSGDHPKWGKSEKARLTLLLCCNATGSFKKVYVIGKSKNVRPFRNIKLPLPYYVDEKAWMTSDLWDIILVSLNEEMEREQRKIVLFVDNAACHKVTSQLNNINIKFLPPIATAFNQGIIHAFKAQYRHIIVKKQLCALERKLSKVQFLKSISILDTLYFIKRAWSLVKPQTIANCFIDAGFNIAAETALEYEEDEGVNFLTNIPNREAYIHCDADLQCYGQLTEEEIVRRQDDDVICVEDDSLEEIEDEKNDDANFPTAREALAALNVVERYCTRHNVKNVESIFEIEEQILVKTFNQSKMRSYINSLEIKTASRAIPKINFKFT